MHSLDFEEEPPKRQRQDISLEKTKLIQPLHQHDFLLKNIYSCSRIVWDSNQYCNQHNLHEQL